MRKEEKPEDNKTDRPLRYNHEKWEKFLQSAKKRQGNEKEGGKENCETENDEYHDRIRRLIQAYKRDHASEILKYNKEYEYAIEEEYVNKLYKNRSDIFLNCCLRKCKVMILTANPVEMAILHREMTRGNRQVIKKIVSGNIVYFIFKWGKYKVVHLHQLECGANTEYGTNSLLNEALLHCTPNVIISLGVAFGIDPENQEIGEVIVSERLLPYNANKRKGNRLVAIRNQDKRIDKWLGVRLGSVAGFMGNVYYGDILTGGSVLSSFEEKDRICCAYSETDYLVGGEMEGSALFAEANFKRIPGVVIKGICDWGAIKNEKDDNEGYKAPKIEDDREDENGICILSDAEFKHGMQAYAMSMAIEKCNRLFSNKYLFDNPKNINLQKLLCCRNLLAGLCWILINVVAIWGAFAFADFKFLIEGCRNIQKRDVVLIAVWIIVNLLYGLIIHHNKSLANYIEMEWEPYESEDRNKFNMD